MGKEANFLQFLGVLSLLIPSVFPVCPVVKLAPLNSEWMVSPRTWFTPMSDEINQAELFAVSPKSLSVDGDNTLCWSSKIKASGAPMVNPMGYSCVYGDSANNQLCTQVQSTGFESTVFQNWPQQLGAQIVATDNSTYILVSGCFGGQMATWSLMSITAEPSAEAKQKTEAMFPKKKGKAASYKVGSTTVVACDKSALGLDSNPASSLSELGK